MNIGRFLEIVTRRWFLIFIGIAFAVAGALAAWTYLPPTYEARALTHIATSPIAPDWRQYDLDLSDRLMNSYMALADSRRVEVAVMGELGLSEAPYLEVEAIPNSNLMEAIARTDTPESAAAAANALVSTLIRLGIELEMASEDAGVPHRLTVIEAALPPTEPRGPGLPVLLVVSLIGGAALGLLLAFVAENLDRRLYFIDDVSVITGRPVLAAVPRGGTSRKDWVAPAGSAQGRAYRRLNAQLLARNGDTYPPVLMLTSAQPRSGVAATAFNLAKVMATSGRKVLIADCSRSSAPPPGLMRASEPVVESPRQTDKRPAAMVIQATQFERVKFMKGSAAHLAELMPDLMERYDVVIIDAGALSVDSAPLFLAQQGVAVALVVRLGSASAEVVADARDQLRATRARVLGTVITNARAGSHGTNLAALEGGQGAAQTNALGSEQRAMSERIDLLRPGDGVRVRPAPLET